MKPLLHLGVPGLDDKIGAIPGGSLVAIIGDPETYPHYFAYTALARSLSNQQRSTLIVAGDLLRDHLDLLENLGVSARSFVKTGLLTCKEVANLDEGLSEAVNEAQRSRLVVLEATACTELDPQLLRRSLLRIRGTEALVVITVSPSILKEPGTSILTRLSDVALRLQLVVHEQRYERMITLAFSKRRPRRDIALYYTISEGGVMLETLSRV